jgi:hypothetical protein
LPSPHSVDGRTGIRQTVQNCLFHKVLLKLVCVLWEAESRAVPGVSSAGLGETCGERAPNTARMFIDFRLGLRLHARNSR